VEAGFQHKNGAAFVRGNRKAEFDFRKKFSPGWGTTFQVQRADFDQLLAEGAAAQGADIRYGHTVTAMRPDPEKPELDVVDADGKEFTVRARFVLDASGYGRVLPRLLGLEKDSSLSTRRSFFTHIQDNIGQAEFDRNKILVTVHPDKVDVWYWLIPFSNGRCSLGVVAEDELLKPYEADPLAGLQTMISEAPTLGRLLDNAGFDTPARQIIGYSANVTRLHGDGFALLGNASEFLDPVFSSGVTLAFKSASLAAACLVRQLNGEQPRWETDFAQELMIGVETFRAFVESWYRGGFQDVIFFENQNPEIRKMVCSVLAGYVWDRNNPYVKEPRRLRALEELCAG
ncbi:MAG: NAD(P)/FAD-dependent oxidoreductase, partial [Gammaproteobacteria bacterium]|nr:NAD(P)/FAD-dependent oxidoreductase [Gammaproteobacteria bacterium]